MPEPKKPPHLDDRQYAFLMTIRQALIMALGALEEYLDMPRSIVPRHERSQATLRSN